MSHRALVYTVRVHKRGKPEEFVELGDLNDQGVYLGDILQALFAENFQAKSTREDKEVFCASSNLVGDDLQLVLSHGEGGYAAELMEGNQMVFQQRPDHTQLLPCGSLFRLPRNSTLGWWALHVNHNRSAKTLIQNEMVSRFRGYFGDLILAIQPCVKSEAFTQALENDLLQSIKLVKYDKSSDFAAARKWLRADTHARVELRISPMERKKRLVADLVQKAAGGDLQAYGEIVEFEGLNFDAVKVQVELENGSLRTFELRGPESGHPFAADIEPEQDSAGILKEASIFAELGEVIAEMG